MADEDSNQTSVKSSTDDLITEGELVISESESRSPKKARLSTDTCKSEADAGDNCDEKIKLIIKSTKEKRDIQINKESTVKKLKEEVSKAFKIPVEQVCLIFSGQILKDDDTLLASSIQDGNTLHLVIKSNPGSSATTANSPFGLNLYGSMQGFGNLSVGSPNFLEVQQQMQRELLQNPELLQQVMGNPFVQSMIENPEYMRQIITSNPQMREMLDQTPELSHVLSSPEILRNTMEYARNPALIQELIQSRLDSIANPNGEQKSEDSSKGGAAKSNAKESEKSNNQSPESPGSQTFTGLFQSPSLQNIMQQLVQNPQLVQEMFSAPYMNSMMEALAANPEVASQVMVNNPIFGNNPVIQEQMRQNLPAFIRQMQNPEIQRFISNPQALTAMLNIHQGLDQLHQAAPDVFNILPGQPFPQASDDKTSAPANSQSQTGEVNTDSQETFSLFLHNMVNAMASNADVAPEERYKNQLEMMQTMGLQNKEANLQALIATFGDVNSAVERILNTNSTLKQ